MTTFRRRAALCVVALLCLLSLAFNAQWVRAYVLRKPAAIDNIAALEARLSSLTASFPQRGACGYRSDRDTHPFIVQHALVPMQLSESGSPEWLVVNYHDGCSVTVEGYEIVAAGAEGVALLRRQTP